MLQGNTHLFKGTCPLGFGLLIMKNSNVIRVYVYIDNEQKDRC